MSYFSVRVQICPAAGKLMQHEADEQGGGET